MTQNQKPTAADIQDFGLRYSISNHLVTTRMQKLLDQFGFTQTQLNLLTHISRRPADAPAPKVGELARITQKGRDYAHKMEMALYPDMTEWFADWDRDHLLAFTALLKRLGVWLDDNRL